MKEKIAKKARDLYLIGISFIAGLLFIVQCGGGSSSIAKAIADAIGIDYSNSESGLQASNLQAAIDELATENKKARAYFPLVYDATNKVVGGFVGSKYADRIFAVWNTEIQKFADFDALSGEVAAGSFVDISNRIYFNTSDCTGTPYIDNGNNSQPTRLYAYQGKYYQPINWNSPLETDDDNCPIKSYGDVNGCVSLSVEHGRYICRSTSTKVLEAYEVGELPHFIVPLRIGSPKETE